MFAGRVNVSLLPVNRVTLKHVSEAAGVSIQTASHILNTRFQNLYRDETRAKVMDVARSLGYRPSAAARSMQSQRSHIIGLLVPIAETSWFFQLDVSETLMGMNRVLANAGYVTSILPISNLLRPADASLAFREQMLDGVVVMGETPDLLCELVEEVAPACIWCDTNMNDDRGCVRRDEYYSGQLLAGRAAAVRKYRRLIWLTYPEVKTHYSCGDRLAGVQAVAKEQGVPLEILRCTTTSIGPEAADLLGMMTPDTAVLCEHMHYAQAAVNLAAAHRLAPGRDFGLAACDHSRERAVVFPDLSRVLLERNRIGACAAEMLLKTIADGKAPKSVTFKGEWFAGQTL